MFIAWKDTGMPECGWPVEARLEAGRGFPRHTHDFAEMLWIVEGSAFHVSGTHRDALRPGRLSAVAPFQEHGFVCPVEGLRVHNTAISPSAFRRFQRRHPLVAGRLWSMPPSPPPVFTLRPESLTRLETGFAEFRRSQGREVDLERFLLNIFHEIDGDSNRREDGDWPAWLVRMMRELENPAVMTAGTPALARVAGRSAEHVARTVRLLLHKSPTDLLNEARVNHAVGQLIHTDRTIADIAAGVGFDSLGHFYHVFHRVRGHPPGRVRRMRATRSRAHLTIVHRLNTPRGARERRNG